MQCNVFCFLKISWLVPLTSLIPALNYYIPLPVARPTVVFVLCTKYNQSVPLQLQHYTKSIFIIEQLQQMHT